MWRIWVLIIVLFSLGRVTILLATSPPAPEESGVFYVLQEDKSLDNYQAWQVRSVSSKREYALRCFGDCPALQVGESWQLFSHAVVKKNRSCYGFICRYRPLLPILTLDKHANNRRLQARPTVIHHEQYLYYLQSWLSDPDTVAVFAALSLNDKRFFTTPIWRVFQRTGTSHLVAMSGLHVGLAVGLFALCTMRGLALLAPLWISRYALQVRFGLVSLFSGLLFIWVSSSYSVERALLMMAVSACVMLQGGYLSVRYLLLLALLVLLLIDPLMLFSIGAWLSFFTVWILVRYSDREMDMTQLWVVEPLRYLVIFLSLLPISLYFFHSISLLSPVINMLAIPWFSLTVIPLLVLSLFVSPVSACVAKCLVLVAAFFFQPAYLGLRWFSALPHSQWQVNDFSLLFALGLTVLIEGGMWLIFNRSCGSIKGLLVKTKEKT